jgi:DNA repair protein RadC
VDANALLAALRLPPAPQVAGRSAAWLAQRAPGELLALGVPPGTVAPLQAALEAVRAALVPVPEQETVRSGQDAARLVGPWLASQPQERAVLLCLDVNQHVLAIEEVARGGVSVCAVDVREIFAVAVRERASGVILAHNHPAGGCEPSPEDNRLTHDVATAGHVLGIPLLDHLIIGRGGSWRSILPRKRG